ncbi:hypothetical protein VNO77_27087 [Canavalia gladiata]|uniref:Uncharacterized protein n=1 Tax=Canavalia gladiata TaxID=3824 RepID=A0AAN9KWL1_CANGL
MHVRVFFLLLARSSGSPSLVRRRINPLEGHWNDLVSAILESSSRRFKEISSRKRGTLTGWVLKFPWKRGGTGAGPMNPPLLHRVKAKDRRPSNVLDESIDTFVEENGSQVRLALECGTSFNLFPLPESPILKVYESMQEPVTLCDGLQNSTDAGNQVNLRNTLMDSKEPESSEAMQGIMNLG